MTSSPTYVLGIAASNHDRAAALLRDGEIVCAIAEERLDRRKHSPAYLVGQKDPHTQPPLRAITTVMREARISFDDLTLVVCGRSLQAYRDVLMQFLPIPSERVKEPPMPSHHLAHAYSAFATSPFRTAAVLVLDEQGHWVNGQYERATWLVGSQSGLLRTVRAFMGTDQALSLGMFYSAMATLTQLSEGGFSAPGKLMALAGAADQGAIRRAQSWPRVVHIDDGGGPYVRLHDLDALLAAAGLPKSSAHDQVQLTMLDDLMARYCPVHWTDPLAPALAFYAQAELATGVYETAAQLHDLVREDSLCIAGGVALNGPAITGLRQLPWKDVYVHPAATDDGTAVGLAFYGWLEVLQGRRPSGNRRFSAFTGPSYNASDLTDALHTYEIPASHPMDTRSVARDIAGGAAVCWFAGRSEWGPRALGARSILLGISQTATDRVNRVLKHRESFRPVGITLTERAQDMLGLSARTFRSLAPYMIATPVTDDPRLACVRHSDGSVRIQVVSPDDNAALHELLTELGDLTGLEAVVNTSFNSFGEPLVETPLDAVRQFLMIDADSLYLDGRHYIRKSSVEEAQLAEARKLAFAKSQMSVIRYTLGLLDRGLHDQAQAILAMDSGGTGRLSADRLLLEAQIAVYSGDKALARQYCLAYLQNWQDARLRALVAVLVDAGLGDASRILQALTAPGGLHAIVAGGSHG